MIVHDDLRCTGIRKRRTRWRIDIAMKITGHLAHRLSRKLDRGWVHDARRRV